MAAVNVHTAELSRLVGSTVNSWEASAVSADSSTTKCLFNALSSFGGTIIFASSMVPVLSSAFFSRSFSVAGSSAGSTCHFSNNKNA